MNCFSIHLKGLYLPGLFATMFVSLACFASAPSAISGQGPTVAAADGTATAAATVTAEPGAKPQFADQVALVDEKPAKGEPAEYVDRPPPPILQGWPKPNLAIVLSGDQRGFLEPWGWQNYVWVPIV
jgi:hypothetical protein